MAAAAPSVGGGQGLNPNTAAPVFNIGHSTAANLGAPPAAQNSSNNGTTPVVASHIMHQNTPGVVLGGSTINGG
jgi:hypothetical protein